MTPYDDFALEALKEQMPEYLEKVCGVTNLRHRFRCLSPAHEDKNPSMSYHSKTNRVHCFSCGISGDVFEVAGWVEGSVTFPAKVNAVARAVGFPLYVGAQTAPRRLFNHPRRPLFPKPMPIVGEDLSGKMKQAQHALLETPQGKAALNYLHKRGLWGKYIEDSHIGWVSHPSVMFPDMKAAPSNDGYLAFGFPILTENPADLSIYDSATPYVVFRACKDDAKPKELKPAGLPAPLWNEYLLYTGTHDPSFPVYIVEGIFDALSLASLCGIQACATCGGGVNRLLQVIAHAPKENLPELVLAFDSDDAGARYTKAVSDGLKELGIPHSIAFPYPRRCKDANELLMLESGHHES